MRQIVKVQPLPPDMVSKIAKLEVSMAAAHAEAAKFVKLYNDSIRQLCEVYDPNYKAHSTAPESYYAGEIKDGCLVITKD
jgi:hypothetical protein